MLASLALATACGTAAPAGDGSGAELSDVAADVAKDAKGADAAKPDVQDAADEVTAPPDAATADAAGDGDAADANASPCPAEPGAPGCPCQENGDCDLPICLPTALGPLCAKSCIDTCPDGFRCIGVAGPGGDIQPACVDKWPHLCDPCANSTQCGAVGLQGAACIDHGNDGRFCGTACKADADCPSGYGCSAATSAEGNSGQQCQPLANAACSCSPSAIANQLSTLCFAQATDAGGNITGACKGVRACGPGGLSACTASIQAETCNGQDDNCNGLVDEGTCDDKNPCTLDTCDGTAQACSHVNTPGSCDADGNACTVGDTCVDGKCTVGVAKVCDDNNPCTANACDPIAGCTKSNDDGLPCSDGSGCTVGDVCQGGGCVSGAAKVCPQGDACTSWSCDGVSGQCKQVAKPDGTGCSDGTACTSSDSCSSGTCAGTPVDCDDKNPCTLDTCDAILQCKHDAANTPCDDGNACTTGDTCAAKKCTGTPIDIATECGDGNPCTTDTCDKIAGCIYTANSNGCSDGNACTIGDTCVDKACKSGTNTCSCQKDADCASSEDGNLCNGTLFCDTTGLTNQCKVNPATIVTCDTSGDGPCIQTVCTPATGKCGPSNLPDGKSCDADGNACTPNDACQGGTCIAGAVKSCDDSNVCTDDSCDQASGNCVNTANASPCDADGNACTQNDTCSGKNCIAGNQMICNDNVDCTQDSCNTTTGVCVFDGAAMSGKPCDDKNACTIADKCDSQGGCTGGIAWNCDDKNPCTKDVCDPVTFCGYTPLADQTACGTGSWCIAGGCVVKAVCGDGVVNQASEQCDPPGQYCDANCHWLAKKPVAGDLIVSEIMASPTADPACTSNGQCNEWFEVYNSSSSPIIMDGLNFIDAKNGNPNFWSQVPSSVSVLAPGGYALFAASNPVSGAGSAIPDVYYGPYNASGIAFNDTGDGVWLSAKQDYVAADIIEQFGYLSYDPLGGKWPTMKAGYSYQLDVKKLNAGAGALAANWCYGKAAFGNKDHGTPGTANTTCP